MSRASRRSGMNPVERMHFRSAIMNSGEFMSSKDAKAEFFLTPDHLKQLPFQKVGGGFYSGGPQTMFEIVHLRQMALHVHGEEEFERRRAARANRVANAAAKQTRADEVARALVAAKIQTPPPSQPQQVKSAAGGISAGPAAGSVARAADGQAAAVGVLGKRKEPSATSAPAAASTGLELATIRASILKATLRSLSFNPSGSPAAVRVTVPGISQAAFAALIGRAEDPELHSLVKHGASYRFTMSAVDLFGLADLPPADQRARMRRYFARDGVTQQLEEDVALLFKPASLELSLQGGACIV